MGYLVTLLGRYIPAAVVRPAATATGADGTAVPRRRGTELLIDAFARALGGWRPDPWPHGVQEEDRDRPWGRNPAAGLEARPEPPAPTLTRVQPTVRSR
jgi:hypothetical protein